MSPSPARDPLPPLYRERSFVLLWVAQTASVAGSGITAVILPVLVYDRTGSAALTALLTVFEVLPYVGFGLVAGAVSDRADRKRIMVGSDLAATLLLTTIPAAQALGWLSVPQLLLVAVGAATCFVWSDAASFGAVPALVGKERLTSAMSRLWSSEGVVGILAPAAAGGLLALISPAYAVSLDAASYFVSAVLLMSIRKPFQLGPRLQASGARSHRLVADISEGVSFLWNHRMLRSMTLASAAASVTGGAIAALLVVYADRALGFARIDSRIGLLYSATALGGLAAALLLPRTQRWLKPGPTVRVFLVVDALALWAVVAAPSLAFALPALGLETFALSMVTLGAITFRQQVTPDHLQGRVNATGRMLAWGGGQPLGAIGGGIAAQYLPIRFALLLMGVGIGLAIVLALSSAAMSSKLGSSPHPGA